MTGDTIERITCVENNTINAKITGKYADDELTNQDITTCQLTVFSIITIIAIICCITIVMAMIIIAGVMLAEILYNTNLSTTWIIILSILGSGVIVCGYMCLFCCVSLCYMINKHYFVNETSRLNNFLP